MGGSGNDRARVSWNVGPDKVGFTMSELSSEELKNKIAAILKEADLETTSAKKVRMQLEEDLKTDLTGRKEEIGKIIQVCSTRSSNRQELLRN